MQNPPVMELMEHHPGAGGNLRGRGVRVFVPNHLDPADVEMDLLTSPFPLNGKRRGGRLCQLTIDVVSEGLGNLAPMSVPNSPGKKYLMGKGISSDQHFVPDRNFAQLGGIECAGIRIL